MLTETDFELRVAETRQQICIESSNLFTTLSTQHVYANQSISSVFGCIRYAFQTCTVNETPSTSDDLNLSDILTEPCSWRTVP